MFLQGERIIIRTPRIEDAPQRFRWFSDPEVTQYLPPKKRTLEDIQRTIEKSIHSERPELGVAIDLKDRTTIGCGGFRAFDDTLKTAEISVLIGEKKLWGQGYGGEAMRLLLDYGYSSLGLQRIWLITWKDNEKAAKLFTKLGFKLDKEMQSILPETGLSAIKLRMSLPKT